jgi:5'-nucleotidase (lipoprotein e(P4) family)
MKKLIIVAGMIILAACGAVKQKSAAPEDNTSQRSPASGVNQGQPARVPGVNGSQPAREPLENQGGLLRDTGVSQDQLILATLWYQKSAEMRALFYQCFRNAEKALSENLGTTGRAMDPAEAATGEKRTWTGTTKPPAVVLDIDETLLDNSPFQGWQVIENKTFNNQDWTRWVELARARPLPGAVDFTRYADSLGVEVFYVSNRAVQEMGPTITNMAALGFADADSAHMLLRETTSSKEGRRALIEKDYEIILLVGDNLADISGVYEKRGSDFGFDAVDADRQLFGARYIVLPNPMYGSWLSELLKMTEGLTEREKLLKLLETF